MNVFRYALKAASRAVSAVRDAIDRSTDPVCQDWRAGIFGIYRGYRVRMLPVADPDRPGRILEWINDPNQTEQVDGMLDGARNADAGVSVQMPSTGFNPATCGL